MFRLVVAFSVLLQSSIVIGDAPESVEEEDGVIVLNKVHFHTHSFP